jgi:hypothetical protein
MHLLGLTATATHAFRAQMALGDHRGMPGMVRLSFGLHNSTGDVDRFVDALQEIARGKVRGRYVQDRASGECRPAEDLYAPAARFGPQQANSWPAALACPVQAQRRKPIHPAPKVQP